MTSLSTYGLPEGKNTTIHSKTFMTYIESHMGYLRSHPDAEYVDVDANLATKNAGNLYSYLVDVQYDRLWFWVVMRLNGLHSPLDFTGEEQQLLFPPLDELYALYTLYNSKRERG